MSEFEKYCVENLCKKNINSTKDFNKSLVELKKELNIKHPGKVFDSLPEYTEYSKCRRSIYPSKDTCSNLRKQEEEQRKREEERRKREEELRIRRQAILKAQEEQRKREEERRKREELKKQEEELFKELEELTKEPDEQRKREEERRKQEELRKQEDELSKEPDEKILSDLIKEALKKTGESATSISIYMHVIAPTFSNLLHDNGLGVNLKKIIEILDKKSELKIDEKENIQNDLKLLKNRVSSLKNLIGEKLSRPNGSTIYSLEKLSKDTYDFLESIKTYIKEKPKNDISHVGGKKHKKRYTNRKKNKKQKTKKRNN